MPETPPKAPPDPHPSLTGARADAGSPDQDAKERALVELVLAGRRPGAFEGLVRDGRAALSELITRYQDRVFAVCLRMVGPDRDAAADLAQDAFVRVIQGLESFDGRSRLSTWIIRVAMNVCISHLRSRKVRRTVSLDAAGAGGEEGNAGIGLAGSILRGPDGDVRSSAGGGEGGGDGSRELDPAQSVQLQERSQRVLAALAALEADERAMLVLRDVQGLNYEQMADVLEIPVGTVKSRLFRARLAIRETLRKGENQD